MLADCFVVSLIIVACYLTRVARCTESRPDEEREMIEDCISQLQAYLYNR
uniref:Uncharacterized protein n=1 Tax=Arion vulgaris TaxID=1028688 RepID=A0A0B6YAS4_9EUPU